jgi:hypothetical protein
MQFRNSTFAISHLNLYLRLRLRTEKGIKYFPLFFFLLFAMFHYYYISFPWGFSYAALSTSMCFMLHSMLFFWHRYELPAVTMGLVSPEHPRQAPYSTSPNALHQPVHLESDFTIPELRPPQHEPHMPAAATNEAYQSTRGYVRRNQSFNTTTSGLFSRNSSNNGMYQRGDEYEDDGSSTRYFVGGEVVISRLNHQTERQRPQSPFSFQPGESGRASDYVPVHPTSISEQQHHHRRPSWRDRYVSGLEPLVASAVSADEDSVHHVRTPVASEPPSPQTRESSGPMSGHGLDQETSALQAILVNVLREEDSTIASRASESDRSNALAHTDAIFR